MQGYRLSNDLLSFVDNLKDLESMINMTIQTNPEEAAKMHVQAVDIFFQMMGKQFASDTPPHIFATLDILESGKDSLLVPDIIEFMEVMPLMYEVPMKEIYIHVIYALENISSRYDFLLLVTYYFVINHSLILLSYSLSAT